MYAIGPKTAPPKRRRRRRQRRRPRRSAGGRLASLLVTPTELILKPGDAGGADDPRPSTRTAGAVANAGAGDLDAREPEGHGRERHVHRRPCGRRAGRDWSRPRSDRLPARRASASSPICRGPSTSRIERRDAAGALGQRHRQVRRARRSTAARCSSSSRRIRSRSPSAAAPFFGGTDYSDYTIEADVRAMERRRQMRRHRHRRAALRDGAVRQPPAARAAAVAAGNAAHRAGADFTWKADTWYTMKLEVQIDRRRQGARARQGVAEGRGRAGGVDDRAHRSDRQHEGRARALCGCAVAAGGGSEIYYDNIKVYKNK